MNILQIPVNFVLVIPWVFSILSSFNIFWISLLSITGVPGFGDLPSPRIRIETIPLFILGLFVLIFPIWTLVYVVKRKPIPLLLQWILVVLALPSLVSLAAPLAIMLLKTIGLQ